MANDGGKELVVRIALKGGHDQDKFASMLTDWIAQIGAVDMVSVDMNEVAAAEETHPLGCAAGVTLEETRRLYVRFGPRPDERIRLARQQYSMLSMLMFSAGPVVKGTKALLARLKAWDPGTWADSDVGSATKVYSRLAELLKNVPALQLTKRKGVYAFMGVLVDARRKR